MVDFLLSVLTGGATGLVGTIVGKVANYFEHKQKMDEKRLEHEQELALFDRQAKMQQAEMENEAAIAETNAWAASRQASYQQQASGTTYKWVVAVLKLVRPILTVFLLAAAGAIFFSTEDLGIQAETANQIMFLATMAISWWFGDRAPSKLKDK